MRLFLSGRGTCNLLLSSIVNFALFRRYLWRQGLTGTIPAELSMLTSLIYLCVLQDEMWARGAPSLATIHQINNRSRHVAMSGPLFKLPCKSKPAQ